MKRQQERLIWISVSVLLLAVTAGALLLPVASAQSSRNRGSYMQELESAFYILQTGFVDEVDPQLLFEGALDGMFSALDDPYSAYMSQELLEQMNDITEGSYGGVGLYISKDFTDPDNSYGRLPYVKVISPIEDTPGWRAGINAGDYIYAIDGSSAEGFSTQDVSDRLRGLPGTQVTVTLLRDKNFTFDVVISRSEIEIPTVKSTIINNDTGYLRIIEFTPFTEERSRAILAEFAAQGLDKLIIDVRSNPGGLLEAVVDTAGLFFSGGTVVSTKYRQERFNQVHRASSGKVVPSATDIVILIDRGSASASEILTGALKDRGRATVIGETSFGKGAIQQMYMLGDAGLKLTTGRYMTPGGISIDKIGIDPDIAVESPQLTDQEAEDYAAILQQNRVGLFIDENPNPSEYEIRRFITGLQSEGLDPGERVLQLMVKREAERRMNVPPVVDMEFDTVLQTALDFLDQ